ncbi:MAG: hypothetical protein V3S24_11150, partial [Candidatus Tectomicrobia bacterium]
DLGKGELPFLLPLPRWEVVPPADNFRVFEDGGILIPSLFPDLGNPSPFEEGGKPDIRQSNRGLGTGLRISVPILNLHKTRLNDPHLSFMGTNDHPGDYRSSGCTACHVVYANDRDPYHAGPYAIYGHTGQGATHDTAFSEQQKKQPGHPIRHELTRAIPSSQCIVCHMHQPNAFLNTYLGYTMWDYEIDGEMMWPKEQKNPTAAEAWASLDHNAEEAAIRGKWSDPAFLSRVSEINDDLKHTQFADYHGHGWNFRGVFKRDKAGYFLDAGDQRIAFDKISGKTLKQAVRGDLFDAQNRLVLPKTPPSELACKQPRLNQATFEAQRQASVEARAGTPVHLKDIHLEKGMHCVDCHFTQDNHGNGKLYGENANAIEISCIDCHGTVTQRATLLTSGVASPQGGHDLVALRTPWGARRFEWLCGKLYQRSMLWEGLEWEVSQVKDSLQYNDKARLAKTIRKDGETWGVLPDNLSDLAHQDSNMECYTCHLSWTTACAGCHLPVQANWKKTMYHFEGDQTRNWTSYNPQAVRVDQFILGKHGSVKGGKIAPVRSSSALVLSSTNANRERIYIQQPPMSAAGYSSQAFNPHFPHTVRTIETKTCTDCHIPGKFTGTNDNNAWLQSVLGQGSNFVNFIGRHAWVAEGPAGFEAVAVTEWDEPQAVYGSFLHQLAYPENYQQHVARNRTLQTARHHSGTNILDLQLRGEYLYTANGTGGLRVFDVSNVDNKGFSERTVTAPVSPLGQDTHVTTAFATSVALPTTMPVDPTRCYRERTPPVRVSDSEPLPAEDCRPVNEEQRMHEIYRYAFVTDREEGLVVVNVDTLADRDPKNNFLHRAASFNPDGMLDGAEAIIIAGMHAYVLADRGLVVVNLNNPVRPKVVAHVPQPLIVNPRAIDVQFRYAFVVDADGLKVIDITLPEKPRLAARLALAEAHDIYVARTYAYIAAGTNGLAIVDIKRPEAPAVATTYTANGQINDARGVKVGTTNASLFAYVADGKNGLRILQLTSPNVTPWFDGFSPAPRPNLIATYKTHGPALAVSKGLDRDRAVDESGQQVSVFGRIGSRPFTLAEMQRLYLQNGALYRVDDPSDEKVMRAYKRTQRR